MLSICAWSYAALVVSFLILLRGWGDRWWIATVLLYGPRWFVATPLAALAPAAWMLRRRLLWLIAVEALIVLGPVLGFCVPVGRLSMKGARPPAVRVLTLNVEQMRASVSGLKDLLQRTKPDIVALQEWHDKGEDGDSLFAGWSVHGSSGSYLASRFPIVGVEQFDDLAPGGVGYIARYDLSAPFGILHCFNVHLQTPRRGIARMIHGRRASREVIEANTVVRSLESRTARSWIDKYPGRVLITGDFNLVTDGAIYREFWSGFTNAFSTAGLGFGSTKFTRFFGIRIDHILAGGGWECRRVWVGPDIGSDHRPVIADLVWIGPED